MRTTVSLALGLFLAVLGLAAAAGTAAASSDPLGPAHATMVRYVHAHGYLPLVPPKQYEAIQAAAQARAAALHPSAAATTASASTPVAGPSWRGVDEKDLAPPDSTGAIGPNSYIEFINTQMAIYSRTGSPIASAGTEKLTGTKHFDLSDPQILWDPGTNRFYYVVLNTNNDTFQWGFSKSASPTSIPGSFCNYDADFGYGALLPDYPKLGQSANFLMIGANIYAGLANYLGSDVDWIAKPQTSLKVTSCPSAGSFAKGRVGPLFNSDGGSFASDPNPAVQTDRSSTGWIATVPDETNSGAAGNFLTIFKVTRNANGTANIPQTGTSVSVDPFSPPSPAPQKGTNYTLDTLDGRLTHAVSAVDPAHGRVGLWTSHTIFGGAGAEVRWYEIDVTNAALFQSGDVTDPSLFVFDGGASPDRVVHGATHAFGSNMVLGFTTSSASTYPAIRMVSKLGAGAVSGFVLIKQSPGADQGFDCVELQRCRWGDYSGATPDPAAATTGATGAVWLSGEWDKGDSAPNPFAASWGTWNWKAVP